jgi:DNA repair protein RadD
MTELMSGSLPLGFDQPVGSSGPVLRRYQERALERVADAWRSGMRSVLLVSPTGSGKTVIAAEMTRRTNANGRRVIFLAPRRELIDQASRKLSDLGINHGIILAGDRRSNLNALTQVASIDTLRVRIDRLALLNPALIIVDEAHLFVTQKRAGLLDRWPNARRVGLTATPCRKDGRGLSVLFDELIEVATPAELTTAGHLVPARYYSLSEPDLRRVGIFGGDYRLGELAQVMYKLVADVPATLLSRAADRRSVVFAVNIRHSIAIRDALLRAGVAAEHVDGTTPTSDREAIFARFRSGETQVLCNCQVATIGFDLPEIDCVVLCRPTKSLALHLQMIGRGLRPAPEKGKVDCLVLDHSGSVHRLGFATDDREWSLEGHKDLATTRRERERNAGIETTCPECRCIYTGGRQCPSCGFYIEPVGKDVVTLDGELVEVGEARPEDVDRNAFYAELRGLAGERGYKLGWADHKFKERFGGFPPRAWRATKAISPSRRTRSWVLSRTIAWSKSPVRAEARP